MPAKISVKSPRLCSSVKSPLASFSPPGRQSCSRGTLTPRCAVSMQPVSELQTDCLMPCPEATAQPQARWQLDDIPSLTKRLW